MSNIIISDDALNALTNQVQLLSSELSKMKAIVEGQSPWIRLDVFLTRTGMTNQSFQKRRKLGKIVSKIDGKKIFVNWPAYIAGIRDY